MRIRLKPALSIFLIFCLACAHSRVRPLDTGQMVSGIHAGAAALPYFVYGKTSLEDLDDAFKNAASPICLDDVYRALRGYSISDLPDRKETEPLFDSMETATIQLRKILGFKGLMDAETYLMTAMDTAVSDGFILIAAISRQEQPITVFNKFNFLMRQTLGPEDPEFFLAYRVDVSGNPQDRVHDWAALPLDTISCQACQAVLLALTANKILEQQIKEDYWTQERQWIAGNHLSVLIRQDIKVPQALGLEKGFTQDLDIGKNK